MNDVSKKLKKIMDIYGFSYGDIATATGIPKSAVHRYVTGETGKIPLTRLEAIAEYLSIGVPYLLGWDSSKDHDYVDEFHQLGYRFSERARDEGFYTIDSYADYILTYLKERQSAEEGKDLYEGSKSRTDVIDDNENYSNISDMLDFYNKLHQNEVTLNVIKHLEGLEPEDLLIILPQLKLMRELRKLPAIEDKQ